MADKGSSKILQNLVPVHGHAVAAGAAGDAAASRELALGGRGDGSRAAGAHLGGGLLEGEELLGAEAWEGLLVSSPDIGPEGGASAYPRSGFGSSSRSGPGGGYG